MVRTKGTVKNSFDNILLDKAFTITNNPQYDGYQQGLALMVKRS